MQVLSITRIRTLNRIVSSSVTKNHCLHTSPHRSTLKNVMSSTDTPKKLYEGNCHCGAVRISVQFPDLKDQEVMVCNCSICTRNGYLWIYPPFSDFKYTQGEDKLTHYFFGQKKASHNFCPVCGTSITATHPDYPMMGVNVRSFKDVDVRSLKINYFEGGKDLEPPYQI